MIDFVIEMLYVFGKMFLNEKVFKLCWYLWISDVYCIGIYLKLLYEMKTEFIFRKILKEFLQNTCRLYVPY
jgi:hypothetical protein